MPADFTDFSSFQDCTPEELLAAATKLFETARPWLAAALAEHAAHPEAEPGACRLCALGGAVARNFEPFAAEASRVFGKFADEVMADVLRLAEELLAGARTAFAAAAADYASTVRGDAPADTAPEGTADTAPSAPSAAAQNAGYERIDIRIPDAPDGTAG